MDKMARARHPYKKHSKPGDIEERQEGWERRRYRTRCTKVEVKEDEAVHHRLILRSEERQHKEK
ncbi:3673_t:CDS:2 [Acaulospora colombiana]|uniref:3673_t:CDS:1 n=1 Tax=Acaulospora colombiana TaxID=27376 RepID=A0ACA9KH95_9GLOM|nr:3673_t:CDS:2 [Acaulospora colombiana]